MSSEKCPECPQQDLTPFELLDENQDAANLFIYGRTQVIVGQSIFGLNYLALKLIADTIGIEWTQDLLFKLRVIEEEYLTILHMRTEQQIEEARNNAARATPPWHNKYLQSS